MPTVHNWQLGRDMSYPYEGAFPDRQWAFVFNINRCIACQTCTFACKSTWTFSKGQEYMWWNNVETKPYGGYPRSWDVKILDLLHEAHDKAGLKAAWDTSQTAPVLTWSPAKSLLCGTSGPAVTTTCSRPTACSMLPV